jgi:hypothetical protein
MTQARVALSRATWLIIIVLFPLIVFGLAGLGSTAHALTEPPDSLSRPLDLLIWLPAWWTAGAVTISVYLALVWQRRAWRLKAPGRAEAHVPRWLFFFAFAISCVAFGGALVHAVTLLDAGLRVTMPSAFLFAGLPEVLLAGTVCVAFFLNIRHGHREEADAPAEA